MSTMLEIVGLLLIGAAFVLVFAGPGYYREWKERRETGWTKEEQDRFYSTNPFRDD